MVGKAHLLDEPCCFFLLDKGEAVHLLGHFIIGRAEIVQQVVIEIGDAAFGQLLVKNTLLIGWFF